MATIKQKKAFHNLVENGGNVSKAMREANYSPATASTPGKLTESKGFRELLESSLPDELLLKVHKEGLEDLEPKDPTRHKYLVTGYELKGKLKRGGDTVIPMQFNITQDREKYS